MPNGIGTETLAQAAQTRRLWLTACLLLAVAVLVRLPGITRPLVGNFATKNAVYAMAARNWAEGRAPWYRPTLDVLVGGERSLHLLEVPVSAYLAGAGWKLCGGSLDVWGRAVSVLFSAASVLLLFLLVRRLHGHVAGTAAALVLALAPVSIIYGQSFMLEASVVCFTVAALLACRHWLDGSRWPALVAGLACLSLLLLTKVYMLVVLLPLAGMARSRLKTTSADCEPALRRRVAHLALGTLLAMAPAAAWYGYAWWLAGPGSHDSAHVFYSVRQSTQVHRAATGLLLEPDFYRRMLDDLAGVALTPIGLVLALAGLLHPSWRRHTAWLATSGLLVAALPLKFYEMNYYWLVVLPPLCILAGLGFQVLHERLSLRRSACAGLLLIGLAFSTRYAAKPAFVTPAEDRPVVAAAGAVRALTDEDRPVVTLHGSTIDLLYYCDRPGWALSADQSRGDLSSRLEAYAARGARFLVVVGDDMESSIAAGMDMELSGPGWRAYRLPSAAAHLAERPAEGPTRR